MCHILADAPRNYLGLLDKLQNQIWRTVALLLATTPEALALLLKCSQFKPWLIAEM